MILSRRAGKAIQIPLIWCIFCITETFAYVEKTAGCCSLQVEIFNIAIFQIFLMEINVLGMLPVGFF